MLNKSVPGPRKYPSPSTMRPPSPKVTTSNNHKHTGPKSTTGVQGRAGQTTRRSFGSGSIFDHHNISLSTYANSKAKVLTKQYMNNQTPMHSLDDFDLLSQSADFDTDAADSEVWSIYENYTIVIDAAAQSSLRDLVEDQKKGTNSAGLNILADDTVALGGEAGISDATEFECASDSVGSDCTPTTEYMQTRSSDEVETEAMINLLKMSNSEILAMIENAKHFVEMRKEMEALSLRKTAMTTKDTAIAKKTATPIMTVPVVIKTTGKKTVSTNRLFPGQAISSNTPRSALSGNKAATLSSSHAMAGLHTTQHSKAPRRPSRGNSTIDGADDTGRHGAMHPTDDMFHTGPYYLTSSSPLHMKSQMPGNNDIFNSLSASQLNYIAGASNNGTSGINPPSQRPSSRAGYQVPSAPLRLEAVRALHKTSCSCSHTSLSSMTSTADQRSEGSCEEIACGCGADGTCRVASDDGNSSQQYFCISARTAFDDLSVGSCSSNSTILSSRGGAFSPR